MFTVKAEVWNDSGPNSFDLFGAERVSVVPSLTNGCSGEGEPPYIPPELDVWLGDENDHRRVCLQVGQNFTHYCTVFVMNERGRTIQTIRPANNLRPINV